MRIHVVQVISENFESKLTALKDELPSKESIEELQLRLCLRISGIPPAINDENEDGDKCLEKVKGLLTELNV